ncbi:vomeronasal type-1 receptor 4-like [Dipodomys merriami]|uniref:vomeronasal type-1 receptor 4-like n=1 Tax=Dipodomys merriami TaxID=94247 RepID=UPI0038558B4F
MGDTHVPVGVILLGQTVVGFVGNLSLLSHYLFLSCMGNRMRATDFILRHLLLANLLTLLISQGDSRWAGLKGRAHKHIVSTIYLSWGVFLLVSIIFLMYMTGPKAHDNMTSLKSHGYCSAVRYDPAADVLYMAILLVPDVLCLGLMLWASTSMLFVLYRHKQKMRHIPRTSVSTRASVESRANISVLLLVSACLSFYTLPFICQICLSVIYNPSPVLHHMAAFAMGCFPALSPFLLLSGHSTPCSLLFTCTKKKEILS